MKNNQLDFFDSLDSKEEQIKLESQNYSEKNSTRIPNLEQSKKEILELLEPMTRSSSFDQVFTDWVQSCAIALKQQVKTSFLFTEIDGRKLAVCRSEWNKLDLFDLISRKLLFDKKTEGERQKINYFHGSKHLGMLSVS